MPNASLPATLSKSDFETLADFRHQIRRFLRFSEEISQQHGITVLQYLLPAGEDLLHRLALRHRDQLINLDAVLAAPSAARFLHEDPA